MDRTKNINAMRSVDHAASRILQRAILECRPGVPTSHVANVITNLLAEEGAESLPPAMKNAAGETFPAPASICINHEVGVGLPTSCPLADGVVSIDIAARKDSWCADAATSVVIGNASSRLRDAIACAQSIITNAITLMHPGVRWSTIADAITALARQADLIPLPDFGIHGVGRQLQEAPAAALDHRRTPDFILTPGMVLALEPVFVLGEPELIDNPVGWGWLTADGSWAIHEERTIAITDSGPALLTPIAGLPSLSP